jgi:hypothetical protein
MNIGRIRGGYKRREKAMLKITQYNKANIAFSILLILIVTFISFLPVLNNGFVGGEDNNYLVTNPLIRDLSWRGIKNIFAAPYLYFYSPLVFLSFSLEYHFFKLSAYISHLTNLGFHLANLLFVFWLFLLLSRRILVAFIVALLFGIHPLHVESVAWVTERKDVLYSFFFLGGVIAYLYSKRGDSNYYLAILLFILSFLTKPMGLTFPFVLLLCDYLLYGRIRVKDILDKVVFLIIAIVFLFFSLLIASDHPSYLQFSFNILNNVLISGYVMAFYLSKILFPVGLSNFYPEPPQIEGFVPPVYLVSLFVVLLILSFVIFSRRYTKKVIFGSLFFLIVLLPVSQLVPFGSRIVADRYTYLSALGIFYIIAEFVSWLYKSKLKNSIFTRNLFTFVLIAIIVQFSMLTWQRCRVWKDPDSWWNDALKLYSQEIKGSVTSLKKEIERNPNSVESYNKLAVIYGKIGAPDEAIMLSKKAIEIDPNSADAYNNLAAAYGFKGVFFKAINYAERSIGLNPNLTTAYNNLAVSYFYLGQYDLANKYTIKALEYGFNPDPVFLSKLKRKLKR